MSQPARTAAGLVTVAIPTIDRPDMLVRAVRSVLDQDHTPLQIIVSDNASDVSCRAAVESLDDPRVVFQRHETRVSMTENWNSCLARAAGGHFLLLSDDDSLAPTALSGLLAAFRAPTGSPLVAVSYGRVRVVTRDGTTLWTTPVKQRADSAISFYAGVLQRRRTLYPCGTLLDTARLRAAGGYDGGCFGPTADLAAALRTASPDRVIRGTTDRVASYTEHTTNVTGQLALSEWRRSLGALHTEIVGRATLDQTKRRALERAYDAYLSYFLMDLVGKRALADGAGTFQAWQEAQAVLRAMHLAIPMRARARVLAKLAYLRAGALANSRIRR